MKEAFRKASALLVFGPFVIGIYVTSIFIGRRRAVRYWGPLVTLATRLSLYLFVPRINEASEFDSLFRKFQSRLSWAWRPFFDVTIQREGEDAFRLHVKNCPFCEVFTRFGLGEMGAYVCQADWDLARANNDKFVFEREHQIGTGDSYCDHTYRRKTDVVAGEELSADPVRINDRPEGWRS